MRTWSSTQPVYALSVAEAEYYAMVEGAGLQTMLKEIGIDVSSVVISTDSSSAKSFREDVASVKCGTLKLRTCGCKKLYAE